jgi:hypothetical protein
MKLMKTTRSCRDVTALVLAGFDRDLQWHERLTVQLHMVICKACPNFERQVQLMRSALPRWRRYRDQS